VEFNWEAHQVCDGSGADEPGYVLRHHVIAKHGTIPVHEATVEYVALTMALGLAVVSLVEFHGNWMTIAAGVESGSRLKDGPHMVVGDDAILEVVFTSSNDVSELRIQDLVQDVHVLLCHRIPLGALHLGRETLPTMDEALERSRESQAREARDDAGIAIKGPGKHMFQKWTLDDDTIDFQTLARVAVLWLPWAVLVGVIKWTDVETYCTEQ
jgi:hypothetical protein